MSNYNKTEKTGLRFVELLTLLFVALKLTNNITWSWWWVLSPIWIVLLWALLCISAGVIVKKYEN